MYNNVLDENKYVENIYGEYLTNINRYQNLKRNSIFVRYLNINKEASTFISDTKSTFDRYNSGVQYDIYDYTPLFSSSQVINEIESSNDLIGFQFSAPLTVTVYTIKTPRIEDLLIFNRPPQDGFEIFRVSRISSSLNAMNSSPTTSWFQLTLEYAPIEDLNKLNYLNHYAYSLPLQKNLFLKEFKRELQETDLLVSVFSLFEKNHFSSFYDLYYMNYNGLKIVPLYENYIIYELLANKGPYEDHFYNFKRPYGINRFGKEGFIDITHGNKIERLKDLIIPNYKYSDYILNMKYPLSIYELCHYIKLWIWERDKTKYNIIFKTPESQVPILNNEIKNTINTNDFIKNIKINNEVRNFSKKE